MNNDDYLWDGAGPPDPEVERLERLLAPLRHVGTPPAPALAPSPRVGLARSLLAAAAVLLALRGAWLGPSPLWEVAALDGSPQLGHGRLAQASAWQVGDWLVTDASSRAGAEAEGVGRVVVEPGSRVRLLGAEAARHRLALAVGRLHATIYARPGRFEVATPSALAVDLGCEYTLETDASGNGLLRVLAGWVSLERGGRETFVPAGAHSRIRAGRGPGTPVFETATPAFVAAIEALDAGSDDEDTRRQRLETALVEARRRDAMSLWHMLVRLPPSEREDVYDRLALLVPPPAGVARRAALRGDRSALDLWWNALDLDDVSWWRRFRLGSPR